MLLLLTASSATLVAQTFRGSINGTVTDATDAAVPNATVVAVETATGVEHKTVSSGGGEYSFADLPLGAYTVTASAPGFGTLKVDRVPVSAGVVYNLPVRLNVAQAAETVEVSAAGLALDTTSTTQTTVLPSTTVQNTPMNGRDFTQLIAVSPGFAGYSGGASGSVNGTRANQLNWQIDGSDNNDLWHNIPSVNQGGVEGIAGVTLPLDSIEQFSEQTQSNAETGRSAGGTVNVVTKSGTNQLHGSLYYYNRNEFFAANSPFATPATFGRDTGKVVKNKLRNQQYGASIGGPVLRDRFFYFANYEKQQFIIESPASATEPSGAYQAQAKQLLAQYGVPVNSASQNLLNTLWPTYALTGAAVTDNYSNASPITGYSYNGVVKLDYTVNDKNTLSARGFGGQGNQIAPVGTQLPYYFEEGPIHIYNYSVVLNTVLSPHFTNQVLLGVNYFNQVFFDQNHSFDVTALGFNTSVGPGLTGAPGIKITGFDNLQNATPPSGRNDITGHITDAMSYVVGTHEFRFGGEYRQAQVDEFYHRKERGNFTYNGTEGPWSPTGGNSSCNRQYGTGAGTANIKPAYTDTQTLALADFLAGCSQSAVLQRGDTARQVFVNTYDLFLQDAWQVTPSLNINYGVRYDYLGPLHDPYKNLSVFRPNQANTQVPGIAFQGNQISSLYPPAYDNVSPRIGFSLQPKSSPGTVLRGGFGVFFDEPNLNPFLDNRPPNGGAAGTESNPGGPTPVVTYSQNNKVILPGQLIFPTTALFAPYGTDASGNPVTSAAPGTVPTNSYPLFSINPNFRSSYNYNYNFNLEKGLGPNFIATVGYVGAQARKLLIIRDINQAQLGTTGICPLSNPGNPNSARLANCTAAQSTYAQNLTRPYGTQFPYFGVINEVGSAGTSNYNSLQATIRTVNYHGLTSQFAYTWSHGLDEMTDYRGTVPQNSFDLKGDYGNMEYDVRNTFIAYLNYTFTGNIPGPRWLTHGWQANSLLTFRGGQPFTVYSGTDSSGTNEGEDRGTQTGPVQAGTRTIADHSGTYQYITLANFVIPASGTYGNTRRNQYYAPGYEDVDLSIFKDGHITEKVSAQFRVEMFNLLNHINLAPPDNSISDGSSFGVVNTTIGNYTGAPGLGPGEPFNTQLALKIIF